MNATRSMYEVLILILVLSIGCTASAAEQARTEESLFNGRDLSGWIVRGDAQFVVSNANLRLLSGTGWLQTVNQYTNFVLELEWRALEPGYDSGIFVRAGTNGTPWPEQGWQVNLGRGALGALVKGAKTVVPAETPPKPINQWVKFRLKVDGARITLDVDGEPAWEYEKLDAPSGFLGIQAEGKAFEFRHLRVLRHARSEK